MLGKIMGREAWAWVAFGKHPAAKDYFQISLKRPLARAFAQWVEDGFGRMEKAPRQNGAYAWRFWSRGLKKDTLVCGLGKSSGDGVGRPYPLLLLGEGNLHGWARHWNLLPFVLAATWEKLEYTASRRLEDLGELEAELKRLETPKPRWKETLKAVARDLDGLENRPVNKMILAKIREKAKTLESEQQLTISLDESGTNDPLEMAGAWHQAMKRHFEGIPNTVFMGGSLERSVIVFFNRPLTAVDFVNLWSL